MTYPSSASLPAAVAAVAAIASAPASFAVAFVRANAAAAAAAAAAADCRRRSSEQPATRHDYLWRSHRYTGILSAVPRGDCSLLPGRDGNWSCSTQPVVAACDRRRLAGSADSTPAGRRRRENRPESPRAVQLAVGHRPVRRDARPVRV